MPLSPYRKMELLHGTELNIGPDGSVDWDADFLAGFDICVASVHSHFTQSADEMTARLVRACENPYVNIIGHPTTRQLGRRPAVDAALGRRVRRRRPYRHRHGDQQLSRTGSTCPTSWSCGPSGTA